MDNERALLEGIAKAGDATMAYFQQNHLKVRHKNDDSPVTQADLAAQRILDDVLQGWGGLPCVAEESQNPAFEKRQQWSRYWLVDPLDGTREFIHGYDSFTVNVALIDQHVPQWGCVYVPAQALFYYGERGKGAFRLIRGEQPQPITVAKSLADPLRVAVSRSHGSEALQGFLNELPHYETVVLGSSLKICYVAEGKIDIYPRLAPTSEWDTAAAHCVLQAAGGEIIDTQGQPLRYNTKSSLLNPHFLAVGDASYNWLQYIN
ncbi:MAG: 3'(2'),5'-bisphosphate nucleotidase CysQ [Gammaproteobacteria bacterium]